jgi:hypothetical protein
LHTIHRMRVLAFWMATNAALVGVVLIYDPVLEGFATFLAWFVIYSVGFRLLGLLTFQCWRAGRWLMRRYWPCCYRTERSSTGVPRRVWCGRRPHAYLADDLWEAETARVHSYADAPGEPDLRIAQHSATGSNGGAEAVGAQVLQHAAARADRSKRAAAGELPQPVLDEAPDVVTAPNEVAAGIRAPTPPIAPQSPPASWAGASDDATPAPDSPGSAWAPTSPNGADATVRSGADVDDAPSARGRSPGTSVDSEREVASPSPASPASSNAVVRAAEGTQRSRAKQRRHPSPVSSTLSPSEAPRHARSWGALSVRSVVEGERVSQPGSPAGSLTGNIVTLVQEEVGPDAEGEGASGTAAPETYDAPSIRARATGRSSAVVNVASLDIPHPAGGVAAHGPPVALTARHHVPAPADTLSDDLTAAVVVLQHGTPAYISAGVGPGRIVAVLPVAADPSATGASTLAASDAEGGGASPDASVASVLSGEPLATPPVVHAAAVSEHLATVTARAGALAAAAAAGAARQPPPHSARLEVSRSYHVTAPDEASAAASRGDAGQATHSRALHSPDAGSTTTEHLLHLHHGQRPWSQPRQQQRSERAAVTVGYPPTPPRGPAVADSAVPTNHAPQWISADQVRVRVQVATATAPSTTAPH